MRQRGLLLRCLDRYLYGATFTESFSEIITPVLDSIVFLLMLGMLLYLPAFIFRG